jgi:hypothetical protein
LAAEVAQDAEFYNKIARDPEMGVGHALYALAQKFDERLGAFSDQLLGETIQPWMNQQQGEATLARALSAAKDLSDTFPEIAEYGDNPPPEIEAAQQEILGMLARLPREWLASQPKEAIWYAVQRYRDQHGTPVLAQAPGTSGSPSSIVAQAAEAAGAAASSTPLDGSGVPPQQPQKRGPENLLDRWKKDASHLPKEATTPSGRKLGFPESA